MSCVSVKLLYNFLAHGAHGGCERWERGHLEGKEEERDEGGFRPSGVGLERDWLARETRARFDRLMRERRPSHNRLGRSREGLKIIRPTHVRLCVCVVKKASLFRTL